MSICGIISALAGVFGQDGLVDSEGLARLALYNINEAGVDGLYVNGSTGEAFNMSAEQREQALRAVAGACAGKTQLIAQIGGNVIEDVVAQAKLAAELGYDAVSAAPPTYYKLSSAEIAEYYSSIAAASPLPLLLYYIPHLSGVTLSQRELGELLALPNVAGVKFTAPDFFALEMLRRRHGDKCFLSGFDEMLFSAAVLGTDGAIGSTWNVQGATAKKLLSAVRRGELDTARRLQGQINDVVEIMLSAGLFQAIKATLAELGQPIGECRPPMSAITEAQREAAKRIVKLIKEQG